MGEMSESHLNDLKFRLMTIDLLRLAKKSYTYRELSSRTKLPMTVLSRYVKGHVLPGSSRARKIWQTLEKLVGIESELKSRIKFDKYGYFDNTSILSDPFLLHRASQYVFSKFAGRRITKILTAAVDGIPLATLISNNLGIGLVIAKKTKEIGVRTFIEETFIPENSAMVMSLYIPRGLIRRGDSVLIVDDIIKSGETQNALINLVYKSRGEVAGIYALVAIGDHWKKKLGQNATFPIEVVLTQRPVTT
jgi:adenine/guanine phosphoribosyltransferase-like PRPP-binding protein